MSRLDGQNLTALLERPGMADSGGGSRQRGEICDRPEGGKSAELSVLVQTAADTLPRVLGEAGLGA